MTRVRSISVVVPMLNEAHRVEGLVEDLASQRVDAEVEVLVADGRSTDGSVELLEAAAARAGLRLTVVDNPGRLVAHGLNACVDRAHGDLVVRLDCKSRYPADYLRACATAAEETAAWNVGGIVVPVGDTVRERAFACAMDSPFGGIHRTLETVPDGRRDVDSVYCGAFPRAVFDAVGHFDPAMGPDHDEEFNLRLRRAGGRIVMDPAIRAFYRPAPTFRELFGKYHDYGLHKVRVMRKHRAVVSARSLAPPAFVGSLALLAALGIGSPRARRLLGVEAGAYAACAATFAAAAVARRKEPWPLLPAVAAALPTFHVAYGIGMLRGLVRRR
jgi:glycosyltransferase involved in cell wall biosynthesis